MRGMARVLLIRVDHRLRRIGCGLSIPSCAVKPMFQAVVGRCAKACTNFGAALPDLGSGPGATSSQRMARSGLTAMSQGCDPSVSPLPRSHG